MEEGVVVVVVVVLVTVIIMMKRLSRRHITVSEEEEAVEEEEEETVVRRSMAIIHKEETEIETIHLYLLQIGTGHPLLEIGTGISHPVLPLHPCLVEIGMEISLLCLRLRLPVLIFTADRADFPVTLEQAGLERDVVEVLVGAWEEEDRLQKVEEEEEAVVNDLGKTVSSRCLLTLILHKDITTRTHSILNYLLSKIN
jgi:hypothetical protein